MRNGRTERERQPVDERKTCLRRFEFEFRRLILTVKLNLITSIKHWSGLARASYNHPAFSRWWMYFDQQWYFSRYPGTRSTALEVLRGRVEHS